MRRILSILVVIGLVLVVVFAGIGFLALRDTPGRELAGELKTVASGEAQIEYSVSDPTTPFPRSRTVVLIPSYARSASDFNELIRVLDENGYRSLAMQPRGVGGSTLPALDPTLATYAEDLAAILEAEKQSVPVVVIGHAYGNRVARAFATAHPERVLSLILLAAGGESPTPPETGAAISKAVFAVFPDSVRRRAIAEAFFARGNAVPDLWMRGWYPMAAIGQAHATTASPVRSWADAGGVPMLILEPAEDAAASGAGERIRTRFPDRVRVEIVDAAGHAILNERPDEVAARILAELGSLAWTKAAATR